MVAKEWPVFQSERSEDPQRPGGSGQRRLSSLALGIHDPVPIPAWLALLARAFHAGARRRGPKHARSPRTILPVAHPVVRTDTFLRGGLKMPCFACTVSRTVFTDDLKVKRLTENVYIEAKDEGEAKQKAGHPRNWLRSAATLGKVDTSSSYLITVGECRRVAEDQGNALRPVDAAFAPTLLHQSPF